MKIQPGTSAAPLEGGGFVSWLYLSLSSRWRPSDRKSRTDEIPDRYAGIHRLPECGARFCVEMLLFGPLISVGDAPDGSRVPLGCWPTFWPLATLGKARHLLLLLTLKAIRLERVVVVDARAPLLGDGSLRKLLHLQMGDRWIGKTSSDRFAADSLKKNCHRRVGVSPAGDGVVFILVTEGKLSAVGSGIQGPVPFDRWAGFDLSRFIAYSYKWPLPVSR